ncbi:hypothetical protein ILYODFUR_020737 [Ilyodon furcidens]|uniref:Secreted protein n=1 Tax=Ilyodon furcidens TaxID=33524 RepID=A0ABV0T9Y3_9TELE
MKYVFVLIWSLIPSNPFHGPFPYANTSEGGVCVGGVAGCSQGSSARSEGETQLRLLSRASTWLETESFSGFNHRHCRHIKPDGKHFTSPQGHVLTEPKPYGQQQLKWTLYRQQMSRDRRRGAKVGN